MRVCKKCGKAIPEKRAYLGYLECVNCSTVESYGFVNIINHKTGNTVQVMSKDQAAAINKIGDRKRFGTILRGGSKSSTYNPKNISHGCSTSYIGSKELFEEVGNRVMLLLETRGYEAAMLLVNKEQKNYAINGSQAFQLRQVLQAMQYKNN